MTDNTSAVTIALAEYLKGETRKFDFLLNQIRSHNTIPAPIATFFTDCLACIDRIPEVLASTLFSIFLNEVLWYTLSSKDQENCLSVLLLLVTRFPRFLSLIITSLCQLLLFPTHLRLPNLSETNDAPSFRLQLVCQALRELLSVLPHAEATFVEYIKTTLPGWRRPVPEVFVALSNLLDLCVLKQLSNASICSLLDVVFKQLVDLEVNCEATIPLKNEDFIILSSQGLMNVDELEVNKKSLILALSEDSKTYGEDVKIELTLWLIIMCLKRLFPSHKMEKTEWAHLCAIFKVLRTCFFQSVLPVQSKFVAFPLLMTFVCSLRSGLVVSLVESLWNFIKDTRQPNEIRVRCVHYLADYLARANHCCSEVLLEQLYDMAAWCVEYTYFHRNRLPARFTQMKSEHKLFYTVFEGLIYLITYRQLELVGDKTCRDSCSLLPLGQLINCPFRPLDGVSETLRIVFLTTISAYKLKLSIITPQPMELLSDELSPPAPSFTCPLSAAVKCISFSTRLGLLTDFVVAKRVDTLMIKRRIRLEHENGVTEKDINTAVPAKRSKHKANHFNFNALYDLGK